MRTLLFLLLTTAIFAQAPKAPLGLVRSTPEAEGVASAGIMDFINAAEEQQLNLHSFMLLRHGRIVAEGSWDPYDCDYKHMLYSVTKCFTATAVGFCIAEGSLKPDDLVISFFPDNLPEIMPQYLDEMTVEHLLTMAQGYNKEPDIVHQGDWVKAALAAPIAHKPGTTFFYNNTGPFLLSAIVQKVTGQKLEEYLTPRLFLPLGITDKDWEYNPQGINTGGWGLRVNVEAMAKLGQLYLQKGQWEGRQLLPHAWTEKAVAVQNPHLPSWIAADNKAANDYAYGYGYTFWHGRHNTYRATGAKGQLIVVMPDQDAVLAITAGTPDQQVLLDAVWEHLLPAMKNGTLPADAKAAVQLEARLSGLEIPAANRKTRTITGRAVTGKGYQLEPNAAGLEEAVFLIGNDRCRLLLHTRTESHEIIFGNGYWHEGQSARPGPYMEPGITLNWPSLYRVAGTYRWTASNELELVLQYTEGTHPHTYRCIFDKDNVTIEVKDPVYHNGNYVLRGKMKE